MRLRAAVALVAPALALALAVAPAAAQEVTEPGSGVKFAARKGDLSLLGVAGPLAAHKAAPARPRALPGPHARRLPEGAPLTGTAEKSRLDAFAGYFPEIKAGQECVLRWVPGGTLETLMAGQPKPPIADREFAAAVFGVWLGDKPVQEDIKKGLVSRAPALIR